MPIKEDSVEENIIIDPENLRTKEKSILVLSSIGIAALGLSLPTRIVQLMVRDKVFNFDEVQAFTDIADSKVIENLGNFMPSIALMYVGGKVGDKVISLVADKYIDNEDYREILKIAKILSPIIIAALILGVNAFLEANSTPFFHSSDFDHVDVLAGGVGIFLGAAMFEKDRIMKVKNKVPEDLNKKNGK